MRAARVAHVVTLVSDGGAYGGPVSVATAQLGELAARGRRVRLLGLWHGATPPPARWDGVPLDARRARTLVPGTGFLGLFAPGLLPALWRGVGRADVVHVHAGRDLVSLAALAVTALRRRPLVVQTHGMVQPRRGPVARVFDAVYVPLLRRAGVALVLTEDERAALADVLGPGGPRLERLNNGVPKSPGPAREQPGRAHAHQTRTADGTPGTPAPREVLFLARLHGVKRPGAFVEAAARVAATLPAVRFTMYGADEGELPRVRSLVAEHGLDGTLRYGGPLGHAEAVDRIAAADVYVLPSRSDVFPMSLLEALAAGTPSVCTEGCGIAEELRERGASVVSDGTPEALADGIRVLLTDSARARAVTEAGRRAADELYSIAAVVDRLEEFYERA